MRNLPLFLLCLTILSSNALCQDEWAPVGSVWHYRQYTINPDLISYKTIESVSDTVINSVTCKKLIETDRYLGQARIYERYMHVRNDSVFFYENKGFHLLYDFAAGAGDTIYLPFFNSGNEKGLEMIIDSVGTVDVNGEKRSIQYITCDDGLFYSFGESVIKGIGSTSFMFPTGDLDNNGPLRCYEDHVTESFKNPFNMDFVNNNYTCDEVIYSTSIPSTNENNRLVPFPNPSNGVVNVPDSDNKSNYLVFNLTGKLLKSGKVYDNGLIIIEDIPMGSYILQVFNNFEVRTYKIIRN